MISQLNHWTQQLIYISNLHLLSYGIEEANHLAYLNWGISSPLCILGTGTPAPHYYPSMQKGWNASRIIFRKGKVTNSLERKQQHPIRRYYWPSTLSRRRPPTPEQLLDQIIIWRYLWFCLMLPNCYDNIFLAAATPLLQMVLLGPHPQPPTYTRYKLYPSYIC